MLNMTMDDDEDTDDTDTEMVDIQVAIEWEEGTTKEQAVARAKEIVRASGYAVGDFSEDEGGEDRSITGLLEAEETLYDNVARSYRKTAHGVTLQFEKP
jgi:hypothetical protein